MAINYGKLQELILQHGADSARVAEMCDILGTTVAAAQLRIEKSAGSIERKRKRAANAALALTMGKHLDDPVMVGKAKKSAQDWAIIAHDRIEKAKALRSEAKPIMEALDRFRVGKLAELIAQGEAEQGTAFSFKVVTTEGGDRVVSWAPKGTRGGGGGQPNGKVVFALDGTILASGMELYHKVVGEEYEGTSTPAKAACTAAPEGFDWARVSYSPDKGSSYVHDNLKAKGAIAVEGLGDDPTISVPIEGAIGDILRGESND